MQGVGLVTIGQSPRDDVVASMFARFPPASLLQAGALDLLDEAEIARLAPGPGEDPLVTRLRNGREVVVGEHRVQRQLQGALDRLTEADARIAVVLCTGSFPDLRSRIPVVFPDRVLRGVVDAIAPSGTLGVLMPHAGQRLLMEHKWSAPGREIVCAVASPYTAADVLAGRAHDLVAAGASLIVMDCMGYDGDMKREVTRAAGVPTILANRLVGRIVEELEAD